MQCGVSILILDLRTLTLVGRRWWTKSGPTGNTDTRQISGRMREDLSKPLTT